MSKKILITILFLLPTLALADENALASRDFLVFDTNQYAQPVELTQEVKIPYEGKTVPGLKLLLPATKEGIIELLKKEMLEPKNSSKVHIPLAPKSIEDLEGFSDLTDTEAREFLEKKQAFLNRLVNIFKKIRLSPSIINRVVMDINQKFYRSKKIVVNSNTSGGTVTFTTATGLALPAKLMGKLKQTSFGKFIPESGGFYFLFGLGVGVLKNVDSVTKKSSISIELYMDTEKLKSSLTGVVDLNLGVNAGVVYEYREKDFWTQKINVKNLGAAGSLRNGNSHFGYNYSAGVGLPPALGPFMVFENESNRRYLVRLNLTNSVLEFPKFLFKQFVKKEIQSGPNSCNVLFDKF